MNRVLIVLVALSWSVTGSVAEGQISPATSSRLLIDSMSTSAVSATVLVQQSETGTLIGTQPITTPVGFGTAVGVVVIAGEIYVAGSDAVIGRVDLNTNTVVDTFAISVLNCSGVLDQCLMDLGVIGSDLLAVSLGGQLFRYSVTGTLIQSWTLPFQVGGVDSDGTNLFTIGLFDGVIRTLDLTGTVLSSTTTPLGSFAPWSLDYLPDTGTFLVSQLPMDNLLELDAAGAVLATTPWASGEALTGAYAIAPPAGVLFRRGDTNGDGALNIADAIYLLGNLFPIATPNPIDCEDAADANDDGSRNIADAVAILGSLFGTPAQPLPAPGSSCGLDAAPADPSDSFGCVMYVCSP
ncbi:MAG: dockerin type I repeat-containing protein [Planctomycetota bacterium]